MTLVLASTLFSVTSAASAAPDFSTTFCRDVGTLYASPQFVASHWPTLKSDRATPAQAAELLAMLDAYNEPSLAPLSADAPSQYRKIFAGVSRAAAGEANVANLLSNDVNTLRSPRNETIWTAEVKTDAGVVRRDLARVASTLSHACATFDDATVVQSLATYITEEANNLAHTEARPLNAAVIEAVTASFTHLSRLVHVSSRADQVTTISYRLAAIVGYDTVCTNNPGWNQNPIPVAC
jgi:cell pole-organizing protein PopZ